MPVRAGTVGPGADLGAHRLAKVTNSELDPASLSVVEPAKDPAEPIAPQAFGLLESDAAVGTGPNEDSSPIVGVTDTFDQPALLHPVDEAGGSG